MISRLQEVLQSGLWQYWVKKASKLKASCHTAPSQHIVQGPLGIASLLGIFIIWGVGMALALVVFGVERIIRWAQSG